MVPMYFEFRVVLFFGKEMSCHPVLITHFNFYVLFSLNYYRIFYISGRRRIETAPKIVAAVLI